MLLVQVLLILTPVLYECAYNDPYSGKVHKIFNYSTLGRKLRTSDWLTWHEVRHQTYHYLQHFAQWHVWVNVSFEYSPGSFWLSGKKIYMPFIHTALIGHGPHDLRGAWACVSLVLNFLHCFPVCFLFFFFSHDSLYNPTLTGLLMSSLRSKQNGGFLFLANHVNHCKGSLEGISAAR